MREEGTGCRVCHSSSIGTRKFKPLRGPLQRAPPFSCEKSESVQVTTCFFQCFHSVKIRATDLYQHRIFLVEFQMYAKYSDTGYAAI